MKAFYSEIMSRSVSLALLVVLLCLGGCKIFETYNPAPIPAGQKIRIINLAYHTGKSATVKVDTLTPTAFTLQYEASSGYFSKPGGNYSFEYYSTLQHYYNPKLLTASYGKNTTLFMYSRPNPPQNTPYSLPFVFNDTVLTTPTGRATIKLFNFSDYRGLPSSNSYLWFGPTDVTAPGAFRLNLDSLNSGVAAAFIPFNNERSLPAGSYVVSLGSVINSTKAAALTELKTQFSPIQLQDGHSYTVVITGTELETDTYPLDVVVYDDEVNTVQTLTPNYSASLIRFIHAAYNIPDFQLGAYYGVDFALDGNLYVAGLRYLYNSSIINPYGLPVDSTSGGYANQAPVGDHTVSALPNGNIAPALATSVATIGAGASTTVLLAPHGPNTRAVDLLAFSDEGSKPAPGAVSIRFINLVTNLGTPVDVYINSPIYSGLVAASLGFQQASTYYKFFNNPAAGLTSPTLALYPAGYNPTNYPSDPTGQLYSSDLFTSPCDKGFYHYPYPPECLPPTFTTMQLNSTYTVVITGEVGALTQRNAIAYRIYKDQSL